MLVLHIVAGYLALITGFLALISAKGKGRHRFTGKIFFYSMLGVGISGLWLAYRANNLFLLLISTFVLYQNLNGFLAVLDKSLRLRWYSPLLFLLGLFTAGTMLYTSNPILISFGLIQSWLLIQDGRVAWRLLRGEQIPAPLAMIRHIGQMTGAYIGTFTAFLVVNIKAAGDFPTWLIWLGPTLAFSPFLFYWIRKMRRLMKVKVASFMGVFLLINSLAAQPYAEKQSRQRFAQSYLGVFGDLQNGDDAQRLGISIGGLHFWGHADFCLDIPLYRSNSEGLQPQIATQFKYYPWAIRHDLLRPFMGLAWQPTRLQEGEGPRLLQHRFPILAGLTYQRGAWLFELNGTWQNGPNWDYPVAPDQLQVRRRQALLIGLGVKYSFDFTLSAEPDWESGRTAFLTDTLGKLGRLDSWTLGLGMSSAFFMRRYPPSPHQLHLSDPERSNLLPDFALGRYWHRPDLQVQVAYRYFNSERKAYGDALQYQRHALALEGYKFFGDYHGFVPFAGGGISANWLRRSFRGSAKSQEDRQTLLPHFTLGWDIRPNRLQSFYLRTHLRYTLSSADLQSRRWALANLEVNFIQLVLLLDRW